MFKQTCIILCRCVDVNYVKTVRSAKKNALISYTPI